jgi:hypothetical protein
MSGCFYLDPVNRRPKYQRIERQCDAGEPVQPCDTDLQDVHRGDSVKLKVIFTDPDSELSESAFRWKVSACDSSLALCDSHPLYEGTDTIAPFTVRKTLESTGGPVQRVAIELELFDDRGASSTVFPVLTVNDGPTLGVSRSARTYTVGAPIKMFATYGDPDDGPAGAPPSNIQLVWTPITPDGRSPPALIDLDVPQNPADPGHITAGEELIPNEVGAWDVRVTATNSHSKATEKHLQFMVAADRPPCLAQWAPIVPPDGVTLPILAPTVFQVSLVDDDLDPYPAVPGEPLFGTTAFEWSILPPGATARQRLLNATGNAIDFDPRAFTAGDVVELRVEIFDRIGGRLTCADDEPVCSAGATSSCNERQTWRVEIR